MAQPSRQRNQRGQGALLRDEILTAALRVIDTVQSEAEVSLRGIAREAGISAMSLYAHFTNRDDLLAAVADANWEHVCADITHQVQSGDTPQAQLALGCRAYVSFARRYPLRYALMTQVEHPPEAARKALAIVTRGLVACGGGAAATQAHTDKTAAALSVAIHGVAMLHRTDTPKLWISDFSVDEIIDNLVDAAVLELQSRPLPT